MNRQMQYLIQGVMITTLVVLILNAVKYFGSHPLQNAFADSSMNKRRDSIYTITNFKGQALFRENCSSCHPLFGHVDEPSIKGVEKRVPDKKLLYKYIRYSSRMIESGDPYLSSIYKEYGVMMPDFPNLTNPQIDDMLDYIKQVEKMQGYR